MNNEKQKYYETQDFLLATCLLYEGFTLDCIDQGTKGRATFIFVKHPQLENLLEDFLSARLLVNPLFFESYRKQLKSRLMKTIR